MADAQNEKSALTNEVICIALESNFFVHFEQIRRFFTEEVFIWEMCLILKVIMEMRIHFCKLKLVLYVRFP